MEISDIRIKLIQDSSDRLKAVCSITLDDEFVVRDLKVVEGTNGLFVAMPSRKLSVHCPQCRGKNHLRARFCNECGAKLPPARAAGDAAGRLRMHRDIAHPINPTFREIVQSQVIEKYRAESELAKNPDYTPTDIDVEYEEKTMEVLEDTQENYVPSEYDQLIAGLNKGSALEPPRMRESRPRPPAATPRASRQTDRRPSELNDRSSKSTRASSPRQSQRTESKRSEPPRPTRGHASSLRPVEPLPFAGRGEEEDTDEVNGNIARPEKHAPPESRRPSTPPTRRGDDRTPSRRTEQRSAQRTLDERQKDREMVETGNRSDDSPPAQRPMDAPSFPQQSQEKKPAKMEDLPFGAGL